MRFWLEMWNIKNQYNAEYSNRLVSNEEKIMNKKVRFKSSNEPSKSSSEWHMQIKKEMKEILQKRKNLQISVV